MTLLLDLRAIPTGGFVATEVAIVDAASGAAVSPAAFKEATDGRHVVLATHGFNVDGHEGRARLQAWGRLCALPHPRLLVGVLWPGDSGFLFGLDYPIEGAVALDAGRLLARFIDHALAGAATLSFVSHSLGARTVLEAVLRMQRSAETLILMAGAIEDDCLSREYRAAAAKATRIHVVASTQDAVLHYAFPIGNPVGEVVMQGHPYYRRALGRKGPNSSLAIQAPCERWQLPENWDYGHGDYMTRSATSPAMAPPVLNPAPDAAQPTSLEGWKPGWAAGVIATQCR
jgi:pimeloyl-ACP methyl ester carboxylesterase